ncbi:MAG: Gfo/Idh/MocA family oxidoreductase [Candidatus Nealsonbacteria bacterium]|nr:Gfo/Idh/MocA family oxidoreductase [Candidatus Nealsonbacteria bacterium]
MKRPVENRFNRRQILRRATTAVAGLVAAPYVITTNALGGEGRPPASERVVTAYLGTGPRGMVNVREQLTCPDVQIVAVCDVWKNVRDGAKKVIDARYKNTDCKTYIDFRDVLARPDIDAVGIASPDHWHVPMTIAAAKAGKDVSTEKPLGVCVAQDLECREVIKRYDRVFQYGTEARARASCRLGAELVRSGKIGEIREIRVKSPNSATGGSRTVVPVPKELDYDLWLGPAPWRPYCGQAAGGGAWWHDYDYAIGFIAGWGAHPLDLLVWAFDTHLAGTWEIEGSGVIPDKGRNSVVTNWDVNIRFSSGVKMSYWAAGVKKDEHPRLAGLGNYAQLIGTEGWVAIYYADVACEPESLKTTVLGPDDVHLPVSSGQERNFIECVKSRQTPVAHIDDAVRSDLISHLSEIAVRVGHKITWDPVKEQIVGDEDVSRRLTRAVRETWKM